MIDQVGAVPDPVHSFFDSIKPTDPAGLDFTGIDDHQPAAPETGTVSTAVSVVLSGSVWVMVISSPRRA